MTIPPPSERSTPNLVEEVKRLRKTYKESAKTLGPHISQEGAKALDRINDGIEVLEQELGARP
jgi:hypothetical protein